MKKFIAAVILGFICMGAQTSQVNTYVNGTVLTATQLNNEFGNIYSTINNLDETNLTSTTAIEPSKLDASIAGDGIARNVTTGILSADVDGVTVKTSSGQIIVDDLPGSALANGAVDTTQLADGAVTQVKKAIKTTGTTASVGNVAISSGSGNIITAAGVTQDLVSATLTTNGGPVRVQLIPVAGQSMTFSTSSSGTPIVRYEIYRDATLIATVLGISTVDADFTSVADYIDTPGAGTYVYKLTCNNNFSVTTSATTNNVRLAAYEL